MFEGWAANSDRSIAQASQFGNFKYILELHDVNKASENSCKSLLRALVIDTEDSVESTDKREVKECFEENLQ